MSEKENETVSTATDGLEKKEKVIHTRVPTGLDEELREHAAKLGISVSNLVRNILNNAVNLVEDVIVDSSNIGRAQVSGQGSRKQPAGSEAVSEPGVVLGWQTLILNVNAICAHCNDIMPKGTEGAMAITRPPSSDQFICQSCLKEATK